MSRPAGAPRRPHLRRSEPDRRLGGRERPCPGRSTAGASSRLAQRRRLVETFPDDGRPARRQARRPQPVHSRRHRPGRMPPVPCPIVARGAGDRPTAHRRRVGWGADSARRPGHGKDDGGGQAAHRPAAGRSRHTDRPGSPDRESRSANGRGAPQPATRPTCPRCDSQRAADRPRQGRRHPSGDHPQAARQPPAGHASVPFSRWEPADIRSGRRRRGVDAFELADASPARRPRRRNEAPACR